MKKIIAIVALVTALLFSAHNASAQFGHFGVIGGMTFSKASDINVSDLKGSNYTGFHVGLAYQLNLPLGFAIQPELIYQQRGTKFTTVGDAVNNHMNVGFVEVPVNIQWGPDLILFRPYVMLTPFVGYAVSSNIRWGNLTYDKFLDNLNRFEYGIGIGAGVEIWKFQLSGKYSWSFGEIGNFPEGTIDEVASEAFKHSKFGGFQLSLAFLF